MTALAGLELLKRIDRDIETTQVAGESDNTPRFYVGASAIGEECARARWYDIRWASPRTFTGRELRLFDRGHKEERRILEWLGRVGTEIRATSQKLMYHEGSDSYVAMDWDTDGPEGPDYLDDVTELPWHVERAKTRFGIELEQWKFTDHDNHAGHFKGHADAKLRYVPGQEQFVSADEWIIGEFKTHKASSFVELAGKRKDREAWAKDPSKPFPGQGVHKSKPEHVIQGQHYMHQLGARLCLYVGVNKDDDDLHFEFIKYDPKYHTDSLPIVREALHSPRHPRRISASPSWYKCAWCDHSRTCHHGASMLKNCRTCIFSHAVADGKWRCRKWNDAVIPNEAQLVGCGEWTEIHD